MHCDGSLNCHVRVLLSGIESFKVCIKTIELHFDFGTSRELLLLGAHTILHVLNSFFRVELTRDLIFVALYELSDHSPDHVEFFSLG